MNTAGVCLLISTNSRQHPLNVYFSVLCHLGAYDLARLSHKYIVCCVNIYVYTTLFSVLDRLIYVDSLC